MKHLALAAALAALPALAWGQPVPQHANSASTNDQIPLFQVTNGGVIQQRSVFVGQLFETPGIPAGYGTPFLPGGGRAGQWYGPQVFSLTTATPAAGRLYCVPVYVANGTPVVGIAANVSATTGGSLRLGIYADDGSGHPGSLLYDSGILSISATGVQQPGAISVATNAPAFVWACSVFGSSSTPTVSTVTTGAFGLLTQSFFGAGSASNLFASTFNNGYYSGSYSDGTLATALPGNFGTPVINAATIPYLGIKQ